ncbi:MAG: hypothetical protein DRJ14_09085 [Acidobacteria bacterium]|nr:MAG: hypothetical protein DRJ14_09085 [Acidobacteriota bacterium]
MISPFFVPLLSIIYRSCFRIYFSLSLCRKAAAGARRNMRYATIPAMWTRALLIDNMDSFTRNVRHLFQIAGAAVSVFRTDRTTILDVEAFSPQLILISPGPGSPEKAILSREIIRAFSGRIPIFGYSRNQRWGTKNSSKRLMA